MHTSASTVTRLAHDEAEALAARFPDLSWRQAPIYAERAAARIGAVSEGVALGKGDDPIGFADVRIKRLPLTPWGIALVSQGPATGNFDIAGLRCAIDALADEYVRRRGLVLRIEPPLYGGMHDAAIATLFGELGFRRIEGCYESFLIDLSPPLDDLRKKLDGKWRTDLARGERNMLSVRCSADPADFDAFAPLLDDLQRQKGFHAPQGVNFFRDVAEKQRGIDHIRIHLVEQDGRVIAGHIGAFSGDTAVYLLGAATQAGRELRAAYLLQWAAIGYAKARGQRWYDLGGIDEVANPDVFRFKKRMGGLRIAAPRGFELRPAGLPGLSVALAERSLTVLKSLRKRN